MTILTHELKFKKNIPRRAFLFLQADLNKKLNSKFNKSDHENWCLIG